MNKLQDNSCNNTSYIIIVISNYDILSRRENHDIKNNMACKFFIIFSL